MRLVLRVASFERLLPLVKNHLRWPHQVKQLVVNRYKSRSVSIHPFVGVFAPCNDFTVTSSLMLSSLMRSLVPVANLIGESVEFKSGLDIYI